MITIMARCSIWGQCHSSGAKCPWSK